MGQDVVVVYLARACSAAGRQGALCTQPVQGDMRRPEGQQQLSSSLTVQAVVLTAACVARGVCREAGDVLSPLPGRVAAGVSAHSHLRLCFPHADMGVSGALALSVGLFWCG